MGLRGPKPTPTKILQLRGSRKATQRLLEPQPRPLAPERPEWLETPEAVRAWEHLVAELMELRILAAIDQIALGRYVLIYLRWIKIELFIQKHGETYSVRDRQGQVVSVTARPEVRIADSLINHLYRLEHSFGMNPSARARVFAAITDEPADAFETFAQSRQRVKA